MINIDRKSLAKNTIFNLAGQLIPLLVAIIAIPVIIQGIGIDRFGILTLMWVVIGYFTLFDLGLGRALTQRLAVLLSVKIDEKEISLLVWTSLLLLLALGITGAVVEASMAKWLVYTVLKIPTALQSEVLATLYLLSSAIPIVIITPGLRGILQAYQRFDLINIIQIPSGILNFLVPVIILPFSKSLIPIVSGLIILRVITFFFYITFSLSVAPFVRKNILIRYTTIKHLLRFGGWMTITNILGPFMVYMDRFFLGAMISVTAVAYYTTPYDLITRIWVIPAAVGGVLFPTFGSTYKDDLHRTSQLFVGGIKYVFLLTFPLALIIFTLAYEGLEIWINTEFALNSAKILQWLAVGVFINCLAQIAITLVQGVGRPDLSAKLHLIELPCYLVAIWFLINNYGAEGAAMAWFGRVTIDAIILFIMAVHMVPVQTNVIRRMIAIFFGSILIIISSLIICGTVGKSIFLFFVITLFIISVWKFALSKEDRSWIRNFISKNKEYIEKT